MITLINGLIELTPGHVELSNERRKIPVGAIEKGHVILVGGQIIEVKSIRVLKPSDNKEAIIKNAKEQQQRNMIRKQEENKKAEEERIAKAAEAVRKAEAALKLAEADEAAKKAAEIKKAKEAGGVTVSPEKLKAMLEGVKPESEGGIVPEGTVALFGTDGPEALVPLPKKTSEETLDDEDLDDEEDED